MICEHCGREPRDLYHRCENCPHLSDEERGAWRVAHGFEPPAAGTATLHGRVELGEHVRLGPGARIGVDGFGYVLDDSEWGLGAWIEKGQSCGVVIGDDVHIGANTVIARGSYRDTVIGAGTRIDAMVFIAHNVQVGRNCVIIAGSEISGSVEIGDGAYIAPRACVREHLRIGAGALVGLGAVVVKDVPAGMAVVGCPARVVGPAVIPPAPPR